MTEKRSPRRQVAFAFGKHTEGLFDQFERWRTLHKMSRGRAAKELVERALLSAGTNPQVETCRACGDSKYVGDYCSTCGATP